MTCFGMLLTVGDVVLRVGQEFGIITACASEGPDVFAIVDVLQVVGDVAPRASKCTRTTISLCWYKVDSDLVVITR
jgi:hypothetical protein